MAKEGKIKTENREEGKKLSSKVQHGNTLHNFDKRLSSSFM